jgi:HAMP domain-containing protein
MKIVNRLRRHLSPLAGDTASTLNLPSVRMGLLKKLNLLTVGLIFLTAAALSVFHFAQQWRDDEQQLRSQGATMLGVMAQLAEYGLATGDKTYLEQMLDSVSNDPDVAYASVFDSKGLLLVDRRFGPGLAKEQLPPLNVPQPPPTPGHVADHEVMLGGKRYIELIAFVATPRVNAGVVVGDTSPSSGPKAQADATPAGYLRLGLTQDVQRRLFREQMVGAIAVVLALLVFSILATLLLTRRLVAPMHRLMRAARAVGAGRLDVYVPANSSDELGLLTHTFNHMTQKLGESQSEVANYQRTLEDKVAQRTKELEVATAHAYKLAQHDILTGLPNRSLLNQRLKQILALAQRDGTHVGCLFLDFDHFKRINDTLGHDAGDQMRRLCAAADQRRARKRHRRTPGRRRIRRRAARPRSGARRVRGDGRADARA